MNFLAEAEEKSIHRGYLYFDAGQVLSCRQISEFEYEGKVKGSKDSEYNVYININNPPKSRCSCPYAKDNNIICKHKIALYFSLFPEKADEYYDEYPEKLSKQREEEQRIKQEQIEEYVNSLSLPELRTLAVNYLMNDPEFYYNKFRGITF